MKSLDLTEAVTEYIKETYAVGPEHPWTRYPENRIFRDRLSGKWFALIMPVSCKALGLDGDDEIQIMNVKADPDFIGMVGGAPGYRHGYHMNKEHWLTVFLDGSVPMDQIRDRIDESFRLITDTPTRRIYEAVRRIPRGRVATYGQVAEMAGDKKMARAVGNALHKNPDPDTVPCYRVVNARGELAGAFAFGGPEVQADRLRADGIEVSDGRVDLDRYGIRMEEGMD